MSYDLNEISSTYFTNLKHPKNEPKMTEMLPKAEQKCKCWVWCGTKNADLEKYCKIYPRLLFRKISFDTAENGPSKAWVPNSSDDGIRVVDLPESRDWDLRNLASGRLENLSGIL